MWACGDTCGALVTLAAIAGCFVLGMVIGFVIEMVIGFVIERRADRDAKRAIEVGRKPWT